MRNRMFMAFAMSVGLLSLIVSAQTATAAGPAPFIAAADTSAAHDTQVTKVQWRGLRGPGFRGGWRPGYRWRPGYGWVPFVAGAAIAGAYYYSHGPYYYGPGPYYYGPGPYNGPGPGNGPGPDSGPRY